MQDLIKEASKVKLLVLDVDGILTDGSIIYDGNGIETKKFSVKDGIGIKALKRIGIPTAIITGRSSPMVEKRAKELNIDHVVQGRTDKLAALSELLKELPFELKDCAYMGDDLPDLKAIESVVFSATVPNAHQEVISRAMMVTSHSGGTGAVREVCDLILKGHNKYDEHISEFLLG